MARLVAAMAIVAFVCLLRTASCDNCVLDIAAAGSDFGTASAEILKMSLDCNQQNRTACSEDVKGMLQAIGSSEKNIAQAVEDCAGQNAMCIASVQKIGDAIGRCGDEAAKLAEACTPDQNGVFCAADAIMLVADVAGIAATAAQAAEDCKNALVNPPTEMLMV
eukprot:TRINITY_DN3877_c0_g2_i1.p2 TRINITY_DN3877_c0_g2~~TRINITY_DN3877_c0_g2_i1.p2  ORF type:complete len:164 (+),score=58.94 TRINITY_DN3877_c0_g2_i1:165-656(+)